MSDADVANTDVMIDTDMISSPNFARLVYDGDGFLTFGSARLRSGRLRHDRGACSSRYWAPARVSNSEPIPFDGRSDYVGFVNRGIPAGGVFAGAEAPKTAQQVAIGTAASRASSWTRVTTRPATPMRRSPGSQAKTMNVYEADPTPADLAIAQQQANSLNGNATRSLQRSRAGCVHAVWFFARSKNALPASASTARAKKATRTHRFKYQGHRVARTR